MSFPEVVKSPYLLYEYLYELNADGQKVIDYAPYDWFHYDDTLDQLFVTYMPPPYTSKKLKILDALLAAQTPALPGWSTYPVEVKGHARKLKFVLFRKMNLKNLDF